MALTLLVVVGSGAMAVDLSSLDRQGQTLQTSVDAAALAGATVWSETQDTSAATSVVANMLQQNGVQLSADVTLNVEFPAPGHIDVTVTDDSPDVLLSGMIGLGGSLVRGASAEHRLCDDGCFRVVDVNPPLGSVEVAGSGDGFVPISVGNRVYAVNHHSSTIQCIDRATQSACWPARQLFSSPVTTMNMAHADLIGDRIYYLGWNGSSGSLPSGDGFLQLGCWNTSIDARCANQVDLYNVGHGTLWATDTGLYVFAANRQVYCYEPVTFNECPGYGGGLPTALAAQSGWGNWAETSAWNSDRLGWGDHVYVTLSNRGMVWVHCWDLAAAAPCASMAPRPLNGTRTGTNEDFSNGRLFLRRDPSGTPTSVCSFGSTVLVECWDPVTGTTHGAVEGEMTATLSAIAVTPGSFVGPSTYDAASNRQFFVGSYNQSRTYCHDFTTATACGEVFNDTAFGPAETYGYEVGADCLLGLGDRSFFFTLKPDMSGPCDTGYEVVDITPCRCSGQTVWPPVTVGDANGVATFELRVLDPSGTPLLPADGTWLMLGDETVELDGIDPLFSHVTFEMRVTSLPAQDPWADGVPPHLLVGMHDSDPHLVG